MERSLRGAGRFQLRVREVMKKISGLLRVCGLTVAFAVVMAPAAGFAAGMFLSPQGVRPLSRGGAFVAGADDVNALTYNPAGIALAADGLMLGAGLPIHYSTFTRSDTDGDGMPEPAVVGEPLWLPIPTLGFSSGFGMLPGLRFGFGIAADYPLLQNWPAALGDGSPAPQRYAIGDYRGTALSKVSLGLGYTESRWFSVGVAVQALTGRFVSTMTASNAAGAPVGTQPENPEYDATIQIVSDPIIAPAVHLGLTLTPWKFLRIGAAWESGYSISVGSDLAIRLPTAALFRDAVVTPEQPRAQVSMKLPSVFRLGVEGRLGELVKSEIAWVYEPWSVHKRVKVDAKEVNIEGIKALGEYGLGVVNVERKYRDTWSIRWGTEFSAPLPSGKPLVFRTGVAYEPAAVAPEYLTAMVVDLDKLLLSAGVGYTLGRWTLEGTYAWVGMADLEVKKSKATQASATRPAYAGRSVIGNGTYESSAHILGMSVSLALE